MAKKKKKGNQVKTREIIDLVTHILILIRVVLELIDKALE